MTSLGRRVVTLQLLQLATLGLPFITHAWLARILGPHEFGRLMYVLALASYWSLICDFGFGWSATRSVAQHSADCRRRAEIISETLTTKLILFVLAGAAVGLLSIGVDELRAERSLIAVSCVMVLGTVLAPTWYFQGMEQPHIPLIIEAGARALAIPIVIGAVTSPGDLMIAMWIVALTQLASGAAGLSLLLLNSKIKLRLPALDRVKTILKAGTPLFLSSSAVSLYTASSTLILGFVSTREQVGFFGLAQRIVSATSSVLVPLNQIFYPRATRLLRAGDPEALSLVRHALIAQVLLGLTGTIALLLVGKHFIHTLFGPAFTPAILSMIWLAPLPLVIAIGGVYANLVMLPASKDSHHLLMTCTAGLLNVLVLLLASNSGAVGAAIALLCAECFVTCYAMIVGTRVTKGLLRHPERRGNAAGRRTRLR